jgi:hypothetical protein
MLWSMRVNRPYLLCAAVWLAACQCDRNAPTPPGNASAAPSAPAATTTAAPAAAPRVERTRVPVGPRFAIMPGQSVGPIRPGATVATIERHMQAKCPELGPKSCRYVDRGIEFELDDQGITRRIRIHRMHRSAGKSPDGQDLTWGPFHGAIPPDLLFGMLPTAIQEHLGKPKRVVPGAEGAHPAAAEQHHYDGMVLEYDRMPNGQLVLGGIRIPG